MIVIVGLFRLSDHGYQGEMVMKYNSMGLLGSATLYWSSMRATMTDHDLTALARPKKNGASYNYIMLSKCASYLREGITLSNEQKWWRRILLYDSNEMTEFSEQYISPLRTKRGCTVMHFQSTLLVMVWARQGNDDIASFPLNVHLGFWIVDIDWQQVLVKDIFKSSWTSTELDTITSYLPFRALIDPTKPTSTSIENQKQVVWLPAEPVSWDGLAHKVIDSTVYGRLELLRYSFVPSSGCNRYIQTFVLDFYIASPTYLSSYYMKVVGFELYVGRMVVYATTSSTQANRGYIGSSTNKLVAYEIERDYECANSNSQWKVITAGQYSSLMNGAYVHSTFTSIVSSITGVQRKIKVWGRSCATSDGTSPCLINGLGTYYGWTDDFVYMATTTKKLSTTDTTYLEGMIEHPTESAVNTNGGVTSILIASTRKNTFKASQAVANLVGGSNVFLSTKSHYVYDNGYMPGQFHITGWNPSYIEWFGHGYDAQIEYDGRNNFYASRPDLTGQTSLTKFLQWPNATNPLTILTNSFFINMAEPSNLANGWFNGGVLSQLHGQLPTFRFYMKVGAQDAGDTPIFSQGWYDYSKQKWKFEPPVTGTSLMSKRVSYFEIYGEDTWNQGNYLNVGNLITKYCVSSSVVWRYPETPQCIGMTNTVFYNFLNQLTEDTGSSQEKLYLQTSTGATASIIASTVATKECGLIDVFTVPPSLTILTDISLLPYTLAQDQLAINSNWVNTVQKVSVVMTNPDLSFYNSVPFSSNLFQLNNNPSDLTLTKTNYNFNLIVYQKDCALIDAAPITLYQSKTFESNSLQAKVISLDATFTNCGPSPPANSQPQTNPPTEVGSTVLIYGKDSGNKDLYDVRTKFTPASPNLCTPNSFTLENTSGNPYGTNDALTDVYIDQTTFHLRQQTDGSFSGYDKVLWIVAKNLIGVKSKYPLRFKVCGTSQTITISSSTGLSPPTPLKLVYGIGDSSGLVTVRDTKLDFGNTDNTECPINNYLIENSAGNVYSANNDATKDVYINALGFLQVQTLVSFAPFSKSLWITARNLGQAKGRYETTVKLCGAEVLSSVSTTTPSYFYAPGDSNNLADEGDIRLNLVSSDLDCIISDARIENQDGTTFSTFNQNTANVYIDSNFKLRIKTDSAPFTASYQVTAISIGNRIGRYRIDIQLCGNEVASTQGSPPTYKELEWKSDQLGGFTGLYDIGSIKNYFSSSITLCPISNFYVAQTTNTNVFAANGDTSKKVYVKQVSSDQHLYVKTNWPTDPTEAFNENFLIVGKTYGNKLASFTLQIVLCGQETVNVVGTPPTSFTLGYNSSLGLASLADVSSWFTSSTAPTRCPMKRYYVRNLDNTLFSSYLDSTKDIYIDSSNNLRVKTNVTKFKKEVQIIGVSTGNKETPYRVRIILCDSQLDFNLTDNPLVNSQDFLLSSFMKDEFEKVSNNRFQNYFRLYVKNIQDQTLSLDLNDLMNFTSDLPGCVPDSVSSYQDKAFTNLTTERNSLRLLKNPAYVDSSTDYLNLTVRVPSNQSSSGNQILYFKAVHLDIVTNFTVELISCIDLPLPKEDNIIINLIKNDLNPFLNVTQLFNSAIFPMCLSGDPFNAQTVQIQYFFNDDRLSLKPKVLQGMEMNETSGLIKINVTQATSYNFSVHKNTTLPNMSTAVLVQVKVTALVIEFADIPPSEIKINVIIDETGKKLFKERFSFSFPKLIIPGQGTLKSFFLGKYPAYLSLDLNLAKKQIEVSVNQTEVKESGTYLLQFIYFTENTEKQSLEFKVVINYEDRSLNSVAAESSTTNQSDNQNGTTDNETSLSKDEQSAPENAVVPIQSQSATLNDQETQETKSQEENNDVKNATVTGVSGTKEEPKQIVQKGEVVKPKENPKIDEQSKKALSNFLLNPSSWAPPTSVNTTKKKTVNPLPVLTKIADIDFNGVVLITFNQRLVPPPFIDIQVPKEQNDSSTMDDSKPANQSRKLIPLSEVDMTQILNIDVKLNEATSANFTYALELLEWTATQLRVKILFDDPSVVSRGVVKDRVIITIKNPALFISEESGVTLSSFESVKEKSIPRQLPRGVTQEKIASQAQSVSNVGKAIMITQIVIQLIFKRGLERLFLMYYTLQVQVYLKIYDITLPPSAELFSQQFQNFVEFKLADPNAIISFATGIENFNWVNYVFGLDRFKATGEEGPSMLDDFGLFIFYGVLFLLVLLISLIIYKSKFVQGRILEKAKSILRKPWRNDLIRMCSIVYIQLAITHGHHILPWLKGSSDQTLSNRIISAGFLVTLFGYMLLMLYILMKHKNDLENAKIKESYSNLYREIRAYDWKYGKPITMNLLYYTFWLLRRLLFAVLPTFLYMFSTFPLQLEMLLQTFYVMFYQNWRPHDTTFRTRLEVLNEIMVMLTMYHLIVFSEFNLDVDMQYYAGYSYACCFGAVFAMNLPPVMWAGIKEIIKRFRTKNAPKPDQKLPESIKSRLAFSKLGQLLRQNETVILSTPGNDLAQAVVRDYGQSDIKTVQRLKPEDDPANIITGTKQGNIRVNNFDLFFEEPEVSSPDFEKDDPSSEVKQRDKDKKKSKDKKRKKSSDKKKSKDKKSNNKSPKEKTPSKKRPILSDTLAEIKEDIEGENTYDLEKLVNESPTRKSRRT